MGLEPGNPSPKDMFALPTDARVKPAWPSLAKRAYNAES
jgi:hypothetical protein